MTFAEAARGGARVAAALLGWGADAFWAATPADLRNALGLDLGPELGDGAPVDAALLTRLMEAIPDDR